MTGMTSPVPYKTGNALWAAVSDKIKTIAATETSSARRNERIQSLQREFIFGRFLARVFSDHTAPWVLKGGTAMLLRVHDTRTTKDIDLLHEIGDLPAAATALEAAASRDIGDHFVFQRARTRTATGGAAQHHIHGTRVTFTVRCGSKNLGNIGVDLVTGSLMTATPEHIPRPHPLTIDGLTAPDIRIYPAVDHVADKICATASTYQSGESSRPRDLIDLVVFATTQTFDSTTLHTAVHSEWANRGLQGPPAFNPPDSWARPYAEIAANVTACSTHSTFDSATALVHTFLAPALQTTPLPAQSWNPHTGIWA